MMPKTVKELQNRWAGVEIDMTSKQDPQKCMGMIRLPLKRFQLFGNSCQKRSAQTTIDYPVIVTHG